MKEPLVTYIRIREIYQPYLQYTYGDLPIELPETSELYDILSTGLAPNYSMKQMCYSTFSMAAYEAGMYGTKQMALFNEEEKTYLPKPEDKQKLVPFIIPQSVIIGGRRKKTDKWFQLANGAYKIFRSRIESDFWNALDIFDRKVKLYCDRVNLKYGHELSMEKFMLKIGMDLDDFDSMCRYWREERSKKDKVLDQFSNKEPTANLQEQIDFNLITEEKKLQSVYNR